MGFAPQGDAPSGWVSAADVAQPVVTCLDTKASSLLPLVSEHLGMHQVIRTFGAVQGAVQGRAFRMGPVTEAALIEQQSVCPPARRWRNWASH